MVTKEYIKQIIDQLIHALSQLKDEDYSQPLKILQYASVGEHVRHILNFLQIQNLNTDQVIFSYDSRIRDPKCEISVNHVISELRKTITKLQRIDQDKKIVLEGNLDYISKKPEYIQSNLGRELLYAYDHTVHHMAIIRIALENEFKKVKIDQNFGVAPSTVRFKKEITTP